MAFSSSMFAISSCWLLLIVILQNPNCANSVNRKFTILHNQTPNPGAWKEAHATFYGGSDGITDTGRGCSYDYEDVMKEGYGELNAAVSTVMFNESQNCGACYEIKCFNSSQWCKPEGASVIVTTTNVCPQNPPKPNDNGGWCNPPREHFDLSQPAFRQLAELKAGNIPVQYRRVPCIRQGGIMFRMGGHVYQVQIYVWNVGGPGDLTDMEVKAGKSEWNKMKRIWRNGFQSPVLLSDVPLSFKVHGSDGRVLECPDVAPNDWEFGKTYEGKNF